MRGDRLIPREWPTWHRMMTVDQMKRERQEQLRDDARQKHLRDIEFVNQNARGK